MKSQFKRESGYNRFGFGCRSNVLHIFKSLIGTVTDVTKIDRFEHSQASLTKIIIDENQRVPGLVATYVSLDKEKRERTKQPNNKIQMPS